MAISTLSSVSTPNTWLRCVLRSYPFACSRSLSIALSSTSPPGTTYFDNNPDINTSRPARLLQGSYFLDMIWEKNAAIPRFVWFLLSSSFVSFATINS